MKKYNLVYLFAFVVLLTSCSTGRSVSNSSEMENIVGNKWQLIEIGGKSIEGKDNAKTPFIGFFKKGNYSAYAGCNTLNGLYTLSKDNGIKFSKGMSTMMACTDMSLEDQVKKMMDEVDSYLVNDGFLQLSKGDNLLTKFKLVPALAEHLSGDWELESLSGGDEAVAFETLFPNKKPTLKFDLKENRVSGNGSCNNYFGGFKTSGANMEISQVGSTRMACLDDAQGESVYFKTLEKVSSFDIGDDILTLSGDDGSLLMRFRKKK